MHHSQKSETLLMQMSESQIKQSALIDHSDKKESAHQSHERNVGRYRTQVKRNSNKKNTQHPNRPEVPLISYLTKMSVSIDSSICSHKSLSSQEFNKEDQQYYSVSQENIPIKITTSKEQILDPFAQVKEQLMKPIVIKPKYDAKFQYYISGNQQGMKKKRQMSLLPEESGAFQELIYFVDHDGIYTDTIQNKVIRKQSCCCSKCGTKTEKEKKVEMIIPQFKPKQTIKKIHRDHFKKAFKSINQINQFFRHKLQAINPTKNLKERRSLANSNNYKINHPTSPKHKSLSKNNSDSSMKFSERTTLPPFTQAIQKHKQAEQAEAIAKIKDSQDINSSNNSINYNNNNNNNSNNNINNSFNNSNSSRSINNNKKQNTNKINGSFQGTFGIKRTTTSINLNSEQRQGSQIPPPLDLQTSKSNSSTFFSPSLKKKILKKSESSFSIKNVANKILTQLREETNMENVNQEFALSVGHNLIKQNLQSGAYDMNFGEASQRDQGNESSQRSTENDMIIEDRGENTPTVVQLKQQNIFEQQDKQKNINNFYFGKVSKPKSKYYSPILTVKKQNTSNDSSNFSSFHPIKIKGDSLENSQRTKYDQQQYQQYQQHQLPQKQQAFKLLKNEESGKSFRIDKNKLKEFKLLHKPNYSLNIPVLYDQLSTLQTSGNVTSLSSAQSQKKTIKHIKSLSQCLPLEKYLETDNHYLGQKPFTKRKFRKPILTSVEMLDTYLQPGCQNSTCSSQKRTSNRPPFDLTLKKEQLPSSMIKLQNIQLKNILLPPPPLPLPSSQGIQLKKLKRNMSLEFINYSHLTKSIKTEEERISSKLSNFNKSKKQKDVIQNHLKDIYLSKNRQQLNNNKSSASITFYN